MKALFISNDPKMFEEGSAVRARLASYASVIGELHVVSVAKRSAHEIHEGTLHLYPVSSPRLWRVRSLANQARSVIDAHSIEIVSAQDPFEHGLAALRAIQGTSAKLHIQIHTDFLSPYFAKESWRNRVRVRLARRTLPKASGIRVVSQRIKRSLMTTYGSSIKEPVVIPIALTSTVPAPAPLPKHFPFTLVTVSRLAQEKCIRTILQAIATARKRYPGIGLVIIGDGPERAALERTVATLGLTDVVDFLGYRADVLALMQSANAYIQASCYEGYGASLIEAALAKLPIITTDVGIVGEVLAPTTDALVCPVGDVTCLSGKIEELVGNNAERLGLGHVAEASAHAHLASVGDIPARIAQDLATTVSRS